MHRFSKSRLFALLAAFLLISLWGVSLTACSSKTGLISLADLAGEYTECPKNTWDAAPASAPAAFTLAKNGAITFGRVDAKKLFEQVEGAAPLPDNLSGMTGKLEILDSQSAPDRHLSAHFYLIRLTAQWSEGGKNRSVSTSGAKVYCYEDMIIIVTQTTDGRDLASFRLKIGDF